MTHRINRQPHNHNSNRRQEDFEKRLKSPLYDYHPLNNHELPDGYFERRNKVEKTNDRF